MTDEPIRCTLDDARAYHGTCGVQLTIRLFRGVHPTVRAVVTMPPDDDGVVV